MPPRLGARKTAISRIGAETGLGKNYVKEKTRVKGTTQTEMTAEVLATKTRPSIEQYNPSVLYQGYRGSVYADISMLRGKELIKHRTFSNPSSGKIWRRKGPKTYPISHPSAPSVAHHYSRISDDVKRQANADLVRLFKEKLEKQIAKR